MVSSFSILSIYALVFADDFLTLSAGSNVTLPEGLVNLTNCFPFPSTYVSRPSRTVSLLRIIPWLLTLTTSSLLSSFFLFTASSFSIKFCFTEVSIAFLATSISVLVLDLFSFTSSIIFSKFSLLLTASLPLRRFWV